MFSSMSVPNRLLKATRRGHRGEAAMDDSRAGRIAIAVPKPGLPIGPRRTKSDRAVMACTGQSVDFGFGTALTAEGLSPGGCHTVIISSAGPVMPGALRNDIW
jgi:hypothetical protein